MPALILKAGMIVGASLAIAACVVGILSARESVPLTNEALRHYARKMFGLSILVFGLMSFLQQKLMPVFQVEGPIVSVRVQTQGRGHQTNVVVQRDATSQVYAIADGMSPFFRVGERAALSYFAGSGRIKEARFYSSTGAEEGSYHGSGQLHGVVLAILGCLLISSTGRAPAKDKVGHRDVETTPDELAILAPRKRRSS